MWWQTTNSQRILYFAPKSFFFMNNLNKLPPGVDFTAGGLNQLQITHSAFAPNSLRIYSANFLQWMNVIHRCPQKRIWVHKSFIYRRILIIYTPN
jgi:hypothetical protein